MNHHTHHHGFQHVPCLHELPVLVLCVSTHVHAATQHTPHALCCPCAAAPLPPPQVTARQSQEEAPNAGRSRRGGHKSAQEQSGLVRDTNAEVISMMLQALEKEHRWLLNSLQGPIITFIMDMLPVSVRQ